MEVQVGLHAVDELHLLYKIQRKIKVFNTNDPLPNPGYNLVTNSGKYGIVFVGSPIGVLSVYHLKDLIDKECDPQYLPVKLPEKPTHIAVSCDDELLAVTGGQMLLVYKVVNFQNQNFTPLASLKCEVNPLTYVTSLQWNPCIPDTIALAFYDGSLLVAQLNNVQVKKIQCNARCLCWSPKGKQLVVANNDGTLCQYKPDLSPMKSIPAPNLYERAPIEAQAVYWISTYQFAVVYKNAADNRGPAITIVNTPKGGQPLCLNYEDICYSTGSNRPWFSYLQGLPQWNIIIASSSNSMEMATLSSADGANWQQWCQPDEARPELPLTDKKVENYPIGISVDTCAIHQIPWGENAMLPPMPLLHVLSQTGLLTIFNIINLNEKAVQLCSPPQSLVLPASAMTNSIPDDVQSEPIAVPLPQTARQEQVRFPPNLESQASVLQTQQNYEHSMMNKYQLPISAASQMSPITTAPPIQAMQSMHPPEVSSLPPTQPLMQPLPETRAKMLTQEVSKELSEAEIEAMNRNKMIKLKKLLIKEVNDFQTELYNFMVETREQHIQDEHELNSINMLFDLQSLDTEQLKKSCSLEELHGAIVQLKLELVRTCAVVAEARAHAETKDIYQWTQVDPLTAKRASSVKKLAYYVQTQLEHAQRALDHTWDENFNQNRPKRGQGMIRPVLDEVYQPLVRQQEILGRQRAVLRTLRSAARACDPPPLTASLLRNTPFRNKDPLSKLTKNILNMSIEPQNENKQPLLSAYKLEALRDALSNHKTVKIKSTNIEYRQRIAAMRLTQEKKIELDKDLQEEVKVKAEFPTLEKPKIKLEAASPFVKTEKIESREPTEPTYAVKVPLPQPQLNIPSFTPVNVSVKPMAQLASVARTLFTDEPQIPEIITPKPQQPVVQAQVQIPIAPKPTKLGFAPPTTLSASATTKSMLKDILQNKSQLNLEAKFASNTFMGQTICSPTAFSLPQQPNTTVTSASIFTAKPEFSKPQSFETQVGGQVAGFKTIYSDTKQLTSLNKEVKPVITFETKTSALAAASSQCVPDIIQTQEPLKKIESKKDSKSVEQIAEKLKEHIPKNDGLDTVKGALFTGTDDKSDKENKQTSAKVSYSNEIKKPEPIKTDFSKATEQNTSVASSIFASANSATGSRAESIIETKPTTTASIFSLVTSTPFSATAKPVTSATSSDSISSTTETTSSSSDTNSDSASSIFAKAVASQPSTFNTSPTKTTSGSIFGNSTSPPGSHGSIFGISKDATTRNSVFGATPTSNTETSSPRVFVTNTPESSPNAAATVFASAASVFDKVSTGTTVNTPSVFSASSPTQSIFGEATTTQSPVFGKATTPTSTFGSPTKTQASEFESPTTTPAPAFGTTTPTEAPGFGSPSSAQSVFGNATSTQASVFGSATGNTPTPSSPAIFGSQMPTTQATVFGSSPQTNQGSIFGTNPSAQGSVFGAQTTTSSIFGSPSTPQPSVFSTTSTTQSGSIFGGTDNLFAAASISTTSASSPASGGNIFGGSSPSSTFGGNSNTNVFGGKTTFSQSNPNAAAIFGGAASSFAQKPANNFWGSNNETSTGFGSSFGQATTQASIFGGSGGGSFSSGATGQAFGTPQQSAFGSQQQSGSAFGGSSVFGSKPAFGQPAGFGSPASGGFGSFSSFNKSPSGGFGAPAAFGGSAFGGSSPGKVFGGSSPAFSAPTQSNATFESLATQNTVTFGNLAQHSAQQPQPASNFNTSPSFTGWRG